jgi:hypothetical protein
MVDAAFAFVVGFRERLSHASFVLDGGALRPSRGSGGVRRAE